MRSAAPVQVAGGTMLRRWRKVSRSAIGKPSALAPLSDRKKKSVFASAPVSVSAADDPSDAAIHPVDLRGIRLHADQLPRLVGRIRATPAESDPGRSASFPPA